MTLWVTVRPVAAPNPRFVMSFAFLEKIEPSGAGTHGPDRFSKRGAGRSRLHPTAKSR